MSSVVLLIALLVVPLECWAKPIPTLQAPAALPESIRATLNEEYPGWILAPVSAQVNQEFKKHKVNRSPSFAAGDFDRDGRLDYAVQIALTAPGQEEQIIMVFLARGNTYEETIVQSMGLDRTVYLWVSNKLIAETDSSAQEKMTNKNVLMVLGGPIGDTTYAYEDGKFSEIKLPGDPDLTDPSIARTPALFKDIP